MGSEGTIALFPNGAEVAVPNADAPGLQVPPLSTDPATHTKHVVDYFTAPGLPADQMGTPELTTTMASSGATTDDPSSAHPHLMFYTTVIPRYVSGVRIVGSYAWATFNQNGETVAEEVYWPDIPFAAVTEALNARKILDEPRGKAFVAKLPADAAGKAPEVVVRHTEHYAFSRTFEVMSEVDIGEHRYASTLDGVLSGYWAGRES